MLVSHIQCKCFTFGFTSSSILACRSSRYISVVNTKLQFPSGKVYKDGWGGGQSVSLHVVKDASLFYGLAAADFTLPVLSGRLFCSGWYTHSLGFEGGKNMNSKHGTLTKTKNKGDKGVFGWKVVMYNERTGNCWDSAVCSITPCLSCWFCFLYHIPDKTKWINWIKSGIENSSCLLFWLL